MGRVVSPSDECTIPSHSIVDKPRRVETVNNLYDTFNSPPGIKRSLARRALIFADSYLLNEREGETRPKGGGGVGGGGGGGCGGGGGVRSRDKERAKSGSRAP